MFELTNEVRGYAWGSTGDIPRLLGVEPDGNPQAELWIGAHPDSPSRLPDGTGLDRHLGERGQELPFLLKVLAAAEPLSLQVHPSQAQAAAGHAREDALGIDRQDPRRSYKDPHHKPEMIVALTPFTALAGFRPVEEVRAELGTWFAGADDLPPVLRQLQETLDSGSRPLEEAFTRLLEPGGEGHRAADVEDAVSWIGRDAARLGGARGELLALLSNRYPADPGVPLTLLLNLVELRPGEALFAAAGVVHSYVAGVGIEVMAASDNVLRGGLTPKHVDVGELLRTVDFTAAPPHRILPSEDEWGRRIYRGPAREFQLQWSTLTPASAHEELAHEGPAVCLVLEGAVELDSPKADLSLGKGRAGFIPGDQEPVMARLAPHHGGAVVVTASATPDFRPAARGGV